MRKPRRDRGQRRKAGASSKSETSRAKVHGPARRQRKPEARRMPRESFTCFQCGASVPYSSERCPECKSYYVRGLRPQDVDELLKAEEMQGLSVGDFMETLSSPVLHFDAETGVMRFMDGSAGSKLSHECPECGVLVEISTESCPMCGHSMGKSDSGLVGVLQGLDFDPEPLDEADCPLCGEHVELESGRCPGCRTVFDSKDDPQAERKVLPVLRIDGLMFLRLDVESGEISFLRRNGAGCGYGHAVIDLGHAHSGMHGQAKSGTSGG